MTAYGAVTVGTTAALIVGYRANRRSVLVLNNHATNDLYIGNDASVAVATGFHLKAGASVRLYEPGNIYGIASASSTDVRFYDEDLTN